MCFCFFCVLFFLFCFFAVVVVSREMFGRHFVLLCFVFSVLCCLLVLYAAKAWPMYFNVLCVLFRCDLRRCIVFISLFLFVLFKTQDSIMYMFFQHLNSVFCFILHLGRCCLTIFCFFFCNLCMLI